MRPSVVTNVTCQIGVKYPRCALYDVLYAYKESNYKNQIDNG